MVLLSMLLAEATNSGSSPVSGLVVLFVIYALAKGKK